MVAAPHDGSPKNHDAQPAARAVNPILKRKNPFWGVAPTVAPRDLPFLGVRRKVEREAGSAYYVARDVEVVALQQARTAVVLDLTLALPDGGRGRFHATAKTFSAKLVGRRLTALFVLHEGEPALSGARRLECHLLKVFSVDWWLGELPPAA